jgi:hypothetical protein
VNDRLAQIVRRQALELVLPSGNERAYS